MIELSKTTFEKLVSEFRELDDRDAELDLLLELGDALPSFPDALRTEENRIHGCLSQAWVVPGLSSDAPPRLTLEAASDSQIVGGLIAVLMVLFGGKTVAEAATLDVRGALKEIGLERHLSPQRRNGLYGMVRRIQSFAKVCQG